MFYKNILLRIAYQNKFVISLIYFMEDDIKKLIAIGGFDVRSILIESERCGGFVCLDK